MDILLSALAGDIVSRVISSLVVRYQKQTTMDKMVTLHRLLLRAGTIVEEAEGRYISNQGMHLQLRQLRKDMYRGYYVLDAFKRHAAVSQSFNWCKIQIALESLETTIGDMKEFVVFLMDCPRIFRQPYSTYLFMERCMFGRRIEKHHIVDFLLQPCNSSLEVLPIIGPREVGKTTLVEHVCNDERVRKQFFWIKRLSSDDLSNLGNGSPIKQHNLISSNDKCLIVVELVHDIDVEAWRRFYSSISSTNRDSKVILISRMQKVSRLGTAQALRLKRLHRDEFWYFFRTLSFGSANPGEHQELASVAMKIATLIKGSFIVANIFTKLLRANINLQFWQNVSELSRKSEQLHLLVFGEHSTDRVRKNLPYYYISNHVDCPLLLCNNRYKIAGCMLERGLPKITVEDIVTSSITIPTEGNFELLRWQSPIPPYYSYVASCVVQKAPQVVPKERCLKRKRRL